MIGAKMLFCVYLVKYFILSFEKVVFRVNSCPQIQQIFHTYMKNVLLMLLHKPV